MVHAFNSSTQEAEAVDFCEFEASLIYRVNFRTARATEKSCLKKAKQGAGGMGQWLRALAVLSEVLNSILSNHMVAHNLCNEI